MFIAFTFSAAGSKLHALSSTESEAALDKFGKELDKSILTSRLIWILA